MVEQTQEEKRKRLGSSVGGIESSSSYTGSEAFLDTLEATLSGGEEQEVVSLGDEQEQALLPIDVSADSRVAKKRSQRPISQRYLIYLYGGLFVAGSIFGLVSWAIDGATGFLGVSTGPFVLTFFILCNLGALRYLGHKFNLEKMQWYPYSGLVSVAVSAPLMTYLIVYYSSSVYWFIAVFAAFMLLKSVIAGITYWARVVDGKNAIKVKINEDEADPKPLVNAIKMVYLSIKQWVKGFWGGSLDSEDQQLYDRFKKNESYRLLVWDVIALVVGSIAGLAFAMLGFFHAVEFHKIDGFPEVIAHFNGIYFLAYVFGVMAGSSSFGGFVNRQVAYKRMDAEALAMRVVFVLSTILAVGLYIGASAAIFDASGIMSSWFFIPSFVGACVSITDYLCKSTVFYRAAFSKDQAYINHLEGKGKWNEYRGAYRGLQLGAVFGLVMLITMFTHGALYVPAAHLLVAESIGGKLMLFFIMASSIFAGIGSRIGKTFDDRERLVLDYQTGEDTSDSVEGLSPRPDQHQGQGAGLGHAEVSLALSEHKEAGTAGSRSLSSTPEPEGESDALLGSSAAQPSHQSSWSAGLWASVKSYFEPPAPITDFGSERQQGHVL